MADFKRKAHQLRIDIEGIKDRVADVRQHDCDDAEIHDLGECKANVQLAFRHLEDARMRLGKAIQASEGKDILDAVDKEGAA